MVAGEAVAGSYTMLHRYVYDPREDLPLPIAFLLNAKGDVVKVYRDAIAAAQVLEDAPRIEVSEPDRLARAVPFAGTFYGRIGDEGTSSTGWSCPSRTSMRPPSPYSSASPPKTRAPSHFTISARST